MERLERRHSLLALVLSGDGNFNAPQAGALQPVVDARFRSDLIVGTSAGGLRGLLFASNPTPGGAHRV